MCCTRVSRGGEPASWDWGPAGAPWVPGTVEGRLPTPSLGPRTQTRVHGRAGGGSRWVEGPGRGAEGVSSRGNPDPTRTGSRRPPRPGGGRRTCQESGTSGASGPAALGRRTPEGPFAPASPRSRPLPGPSPTGRRDHLRRAPLRGVSEGPRCPADLRGKSAGPAPPPVRHGPSAAGRDRRAGHRHLPLGPSGQATLRRPRATERQSNRRQVWAPSRCWSSFRSSR